MNWQQLKENPSLWETFRLRAEIIARIREFFAREGFLEVQTPVLSPRLIPESYLEVFTTQLKDRLGKVSPAFLTPSPEIWHKKLLAAGSGNIFEITKSFRNTDIGGHFHNPEFTLLEWYRVKADYWQTMDDCERLIRFINKNQPTLTYQGKTLDISQPFARISVIEAFKKYAGIDSKILFDADLLKKEAQKRGYRIGKKDNWEVIYNLIYLKEVEPHLGQNQPTIIYDFPAQFAPLAKTNPANPRVKQRFELYLFGIELADAYNELTDYQEQKKRFAEEMKRRKEMGKIKVRPDEDFLAALKSGLPPCSGVALGIDRLVMIFANKTDIKEVVLFAGEEIF
ncbi:EF-P lysine aminoacylase GenX [bacterium]|nr:EF-P lysine aminoacylase GenX [bacterium]